MENVANYMDTAGSSVGIMENQMETETDHELRLGVRLCSHSKYVGSSFRVYPNITPIWP